MQNDAHRHIIRAAAFAEAGCRLESLVSGQRTKSGRAALLMASEKLKDEATAIRQMADQMRKAHL